MNVPAVPSIKPSALHQQIPGKITFQWSFGTPWFWLIVATFVVTLVGLIQTTTQGQNDSNQKTFAITTLAMGAGFSAVAVAYLFFGFWTLQLPLNATDMPESLLPKSVQTLDTVVKALSF